MSKKSYTYLQIRNHIRFLAEQGARLKVLTLEIFADDSSVTLIDVDDIRIAMFRDMEEFMSCSSLENAIKNHPYPNKSLI